MFCVFYYKMIFLLKFNSMKKIFTLVVIAGLFMNSCGKKEEMVEYTPMIAGTWKLSKIAVISGKDGIIISSVTAKDCDLMNTYEFKNDNTFEFKKYSGGGCSTMNSETGNYDYQNSPSINKLVMKFSNQPNPKEYVVQTLTELELQYYSLPLQDMNNDGIMDKTVVYMHK